MAQTLQSEVTGTVWKLEVIEGQEVTAEQTLLVMESMKMEIPMTAPRAGRVLRLLVGEGEVVAEGQGVVVLG
ncbi:MAG: acetyl-CoA carboxylase biotin carboxyl carrier protein subunit [Burkholderiaceae bacterium]|jgi:biotin carboxyl carrier protein|nr:acetyl-CoA carboxylase biotin carboxyl carrier protein subunit [Pseudomonadota bacterium]MBS0597856.1 acetyl-CoA carboxylase biotin carboxyl carrier protein subunit [Pseudomonadota bacterium]MCO5116598.1 acetyl-CoA carboxylase biotin carboxyl carrier protein subunit [Burkholderiaceae bacterium]MCP5219200.1 acetyl-CoA carboxylase biotin carboxyl carrier protein subunit [Burkholderiaceae bacterium]